MDPQTVIFVLALHLTCTGGLLYLIGRDMPGSGLGPWAAGSMLFGTAYFGRLFMHASSFEALYLVLDLAMVCAMLQFDRGLRCFYKRPTLSLRWSVAVLAGYALMHGMATWLAGALGRHALLDTALFACYTITGVQACIESKRHQAAERLSLLTLGLLMCGQGVMNFVRTIDIISHGTASATSSPFTKAFYAYSSITAVMLALTLLWMVFVRLSTRLAEAATHDPLTGALNRNGLMNTLNMHFARRTPDSLVLIMVDLDHFKQINDEYGHSEGDKVLAAVTHALTDSLRASDFVARVGGEEFVVGCSPITVTDAMVLAQRLCRRIAGLHLQTKDGRTLRFTASFGLSQQVLSLDGYDVAIRTADKALYRAKAAGRNCVFGPTSTVAGAGEAVVGNATTHTQHHTQQHTPPSTVPMSLDPLGHPSRKSKLPSPRVAANAPGTPGAPSEQAAQAQDSDCLA